MTKTVEEATTSTAGGSSTSALHEVISGKVKKKEREDGGKSEITKPRVKLHKFAMLLAYQGKNYFGMQLQKEHETIESHILDAFLKLGWISEQWRQQPILFHFQRAARTDKAVSAVRQICGMQLPANVDYAKIGPNSLNEILPSDIRVVGMRRATHMFHPQKFCDARTYSYTLPTFAFAKSHQLTNGSFRISQETLDEINSLLDIYLGTHNFYNYTSKREFTDRSCHRYIQAFKCGQPFIYKDVLRNEDVEFVTIVVKGQSFILHQIRKMIGMVITVVRELQMKSYIQRSFEGQRIDVPKAPGLGLLLERVHYENYDRKFSNSGHQPLTVWGDREEAEIERIKYELITKEIMETEITSQSMMQWLADLVHHDFQRDVEAEEIEKKTFVTMAAATAEKAIDEAAIEATKMNTVNEEGTVEATKNVENTINDDGNRKAETTNDVDSMKNDESIRVTESVDSGRVDEGARSVEKA